jgi:hypothetical protein
MIISVKVKPNSREDKIEKIDGNVYNISVKTPAKEGKANISVIKLLSKYFEVSFRKIIVKNSTSRTKLIEIRTE